MTYLVYFRDKFHQGVANSYRELEAESLNAAKAKVDALLALYDEVVRDRQIVVCHIVEAAPRQGFEEYLEAHDTLEEALLMGGTLCRRNSGMNRFLK